MAVYKNHDTLPVKSEKQLLVTIVLSLSLRVDVEECLSSIFLINSLFGDLYRQQRSMSNGIQKRERERNWMSISSFSLHLQVVISATMEDRRWFCLPITEVSAGEQCSQEAA